MQSAPETTIPASSPVPLLTTDKAAIVGPAPHGIAEAQHSIAETPHKIKSLFPVLLLACFAALGFFLAWLLDSSSVLLGQKPDRKTQLLMVLMCIGPAAALVIFRARKPDETQR